MHVELHHSLQGRPDTAQAVELTRACVHCGFCLETCPTYLDRRDERDSPRGRIYLIKQLLENGEAGAGTRQHLDRCLTCRSCETTCPSGMRYGDLLDTGRALVEEVAPRPARERLWRWTLRRTLRHLRLLAPALRLAQLCRPALPSALRRALPARQVTGELPTQTQPRRMLILEGCVQQTATPRTNASARRVLHRLGISLISAPRARCCGALDYHLGAHADGLNEMRRNIDAWWPLIEDGAQAIISSASGCGATIADYGRLLAQDPDYAEKAARVSALHRDLAEVLLAEDLSLLGLHKRRPRIALHTPCTLQHAQRQPELLAQILSRAGYVLAATQDDHLCCGSAGTYSVLQRSASARLRTRKLAALEGDRPDIIATANVGCQLHLQSGTERPVQHWIELLDDG